MTRLTAIAEANTHKEGTLSVSRANEILTAVGAPTLEDTGEPDIQVSGELVYSLVLEQRIIDLESA